MVRAISRFVRPSRERVGVRSLSTPQRPQFVRTLDDLSPAKTHPNGGPAGVRMPPEYRPDSCPTHPSLRFVPGLAATSALSRPVAGQSKIRPCALSRDWPQRRRSDGQSRDKAQGSTTHRRPGCPQSLRSSRRSIASPMRCARGCAEPFCRPQPSRTPGRRMDRRSLTSRDCTWRDIPRTPRAVRGV